MLSFKGQYIKKNCISLVNVFEDIFTYLLSDSFRHLSIACSRQLVQVYPWPGISYIVAVQMFPRRTLVSLEISFGKILRV